MTSKSKIVIAAAALTASVVSPAFAQSPDHTGSQMPYYYDSTGKQTWGTWGPQDVTGSRRSTTRSHGLYGYVAPRRSQRPQ